MRLLVPHLYFWKSAKWVSKLTLLTRDQPGLLGAERLPRPAATRGASSGTRVTERALGARAGAGAPRPAAGGRRRSPGCAGRSRASVELRLDVADRIDHMPGQHYVVRLTAEDGYTAQRSYSVASAPGDPLVELFIERLDDGEVSTLPRRRRRARRRARGARPDRRLVRLGRRVAGAAARPAASASSRSSRCSGTRGAARSPGPAADRRLQPHAGRAAVRRRADRGAARSSSLTREAHGIRPAGRLTAADLVPLWEPGQTAYVCGSASFAEAASRTCSSAWACRPPSIRVERFGPSGAG